MSIEAIPFVGEAASSSCGKCGADRAAAAVAWHQPAKCHHDRGEHLHMTCGCGFEWVTPTNDTAGRPLTAREVQVLASAGRGMSNLEIAHALSVSEQTVKNHLSRIFRKLGVSDRTEAVVYAIRRGWVPA